MIITVEQKQPEGFRPVTITLNTRQDVGDLAFFLQFAADMFLERVEQEAAERGSHLSPFYLVATKIKMKQLSEELKNKYNTF